MGKVTYINDSAKATHLLCKKEGINPQNLVSLDGLDKQVIGLELSEADTSYMYPLGCTVKTAVPCLTHAGLVINGNMVLDYMLLINLLKTKKQGDK